MRTASMFQDISAATNSAAHAETNSSLTSALDLARAATVAAAAKNGEINRSLLAALDLANVSNNQLLTMLAEQTGNLAEAASASKLLNATRALTQAADNQHQTTNKASMFRPSFTQSERSSIETATKANDAQEVPSAAPAA